MQSVTISNVEGNTPLHWACLNGQIDAVRTLLGAGATATALNSHDNTPVDEALQRDFQDIVEVINEFNNTSSKYVEDIDDIPDEDADDMATSNPGAVNGNER